MKLIINKHRQDEKAEIDEHSRITWEFPDGRYVEVYQDENGQIMVAAADSLAIQLHASNRCVLVPVIYTAETTTDRLGYQEVSE